MLSNTKLNDIKPLHPHIRLIRGKWHCGLSRSSLDSIIALGHLAYVGIIGVGDSPESAYCMMKARLHQFSSQIEWGVNSINGKSA